jgi:hypothetical protein
MAAVVAGKSVPTVLVHGVGLLHSAEPWCEA